MKLFHGSNTRIVEIDFSQCRPYKDFGRGFYLTEIEEQAQQMAKRTAAIYGGDPIVTCFDFAIEEAFGNQQLQIKQFLQPDEEWALFVMANRSRTSRLAVHMYDIVIGPVANDAIATLFRNYDDGVIDLPMLVHGLKFSKVSSQYFFRSSGAIAYLSLV